MLWNKNAFERVESMRVEKQCGWAKKSAEMGPILREDDRYSSPIENSLFHVILE